MPTLSEEIDTNVDIHQFTKRSFHENSFDEVAKEEEKSEERYNDNSKEELD